MKKVLAFLCLLMGSGIYLLFRSRHHLVFKFVDALGFGPLVDSMRTGVSDFNLSEFVCFALPDGLWSLSYILFMDSIFHNSTISSRLLWCSIIPLIGATSELLQFAAILPGVFDSLDLVAYLLPLILYLLSILIFSKKTPIY